VKRCMVVPPESPDRDGPERLKHSWPPHPSDGTWFPPPQKKVNAACYKQLHRFIFDMTDGGASSSKNRGGTETKESGPCDLREKPP
jgi:hypothetical protein